MYSPYDFRTIIQDPAQTAVAWKAILREPLEEVLNYWEKSGKPCEQISTYCKGIYEGIVNRRWMYFHLDLLADYPEFHKDALSALYILWNQLNFKLQSYPEPSLYIDLPHGEPINWSEYEKIYILKRMQYKLSIDLVLNNELVTLGIFTSRQAQEIYQRIFWLQLTFKDKT